MPCMASVPWGGRPWREPRTEHVRPMWEVMHANEEMEGLERCYLVKCAALDEASLLDGLAISFVLNFRSLNFEETPGNGWRVLIQ